MLCATLPCYVLRCSVPPCLALRCLALLYATLLALPCLALSYAACVVLFCFALRYPGLRCPVLLYAAPLLLALRCPSLLNAAPPCSAPPGFALNWQPYLDMPLPACAGLLCCSTLCCVALRFLLSLLCQALPCQVLHWHYCPALSCATTSFVNLPSFSMRCSALPYAALPILFLCTALPLAANHILALRFPVPPCLLLPRTFLSHADLLYLEPPCHALRSPYKNRVAFNW